MDNSMSKVWFTFSMIILTPVLLFIVFEKIQFSMFRGIGGF